MRGISITTFELFLPIVLYEEPGLENPWQLYLFGGLSYLQVVTGHLLFT